MTGQVYAVASGKGGVGKTTTVANLGVTLRANDQSVALVDADLGMPDLATLLDMEGDPTVHDVLAGEASLEEALIEEADGFAILPGSRDLEGFAIAEPARLGEIIESLAEDYDYVLIDTGAGLSYEDVLPLGLVDGIILVTSPDPAATGDTRRTVEVADLLDGSLQGVVVTRAGPSTDAEAIADDLGVELLGVIPDDPAVKESTAAGRPLEAFDPDSAAAEAYRRLATALIGEEVEPLPIPEPASGGGKPASTETEASAPSGSSGPDGAEPEADDTAEEAIENEGEDAAGPRADSTDDSAGLLDRIKRRFG